MCDLIHYIKVSTSPNGCDSYNAKQFKCDRYLDCEICLEDKIIEHDKQIRADTIDEVGRAMYHQCFECDNDEDMQKWDSGNWFRYKLFENVIEQLKEQKK